MQNCLIIGAGSTLKHYKKQINKLIAKNNFTIIGVNNVSHMFSLDYHLWTNYKRFRKYHSCIKSHSILLLADNIVKEVALKFSHGPVNNVVAIGDDINKWRTSGLRAIQYAHDNGAKNIYCVGFDGYTLLCGGDQHCYSSGMSDLNHTKKKRKGFNFELEKDDVIYSHMRRMDKEGVKFRILTPTVFEEFYYGSVM